MILVFFIAFLLILIIMMVLSKLELSISELDIHNNNDEKKNNNLKIKISLKIFNIRFISIKFDKSKLANIYAKNKINSSKKHISLKKIMTVENKNSIKAEIKKLSFKLDLLDLKIQVGIGDCVSTSYIVTIISIIISNILPYIINTKKSVADFKYKIMPIYEDKFLYEIKLNCIISAKLVHIIYIIFLIRKGRSDKNERTSNRKSYDYSYE